VVNGGNLMNIQFHTGKGFTLVELLIALVIGSVGILGMASLQLNSLKSTNQSFFRSQASLFSYEIVDYMRANRKAAVAQNYNIVLSELSDVTAPGTSGTLADKERYRWFSMIDNVLPNSKASINCDVNATCKIHIQWTSRITQGNSSMIIMAQL
jgi:type IV pilus assembly protein PilV